MMNEMLLVVNFADKKQKLTKNSSKMSYELV